MNITKIRNTIADRIDVRAWGFVPDNPAPPCVIIYPETIDYSLTFQNGAHKATFVALCLAGSVSDRNGQSTLDEWLNTDSDKSLLVAIENVELGNDGDTCQVVGVRKYGDVELNGVRYYSAEIVVEVIAR